MAAPPAATTPTPAITTTQTLIKLAADAGRTFLTTYYAALDAKSPAIAGFYVAAPHIVWNGNALHNGTEFAQFYSFMPKTVFEAQSYDAQPMMADGKGGTSIVLIVSGQVVVGEGQDKRTRVFSESFVLVPTEGGEGGLKIQNQAFRVVV